MSTSELSLPGLGSPAPRPVASAAAHSRQRVIVYSNNRYCGETTRGALTSVRGSLPESIFRRDSEFLSCSTHVRMDDGVWRWEIVGCPEPSDVGAVLQALRSGRWGSLPPGAAALARSWRVLN